MRSWTQWRDEVIEQAASMASAAGWRVRSVHIASTGSAYVRLEADQARGLAEVRIATHAPHPERAKRSWLFNVDQRDPFALWCLFAWLHKRRSQA